MIDIPKQLVTDINSKVIKFLSPLSCHSDIVLPLESILKNYNDVQGFCPDPENYKYCFWYKENTIFMFAVGMQNISLKLPKEFVSEALSNSGENIPNLNDNWVSFPYNDSQLKRWVELSHKYCSVK